MDTLFELHDPKPAKPKAAAKPKPDPQPVIADRVARKPRRRSGRTPPEFAILPTAAEFPEGRFVRIEAGQVRPSDLVWSVMAREWQRADWPHWTTPADLAENCIYVIRSIEDLRTPGDRNYLIRR